MQFLADVPVVQLAIGAGCRNYRFFAASLFDTRPSLEEMVRFRPVAANLEQEILELQARKTCPFAHVGVYVDGQGAWVLAKTHTGVQLDSARGSISTILAPLPAEQRLCVSTSLHAFDELDKVRLNTWSTVASLRPKFPKAPTPADDSDCGLPSHGAPIASAVPIGARRKRR